MFDVYAHILAHDQCAGDDRRLKPIRFPAVLAAISFCDLNIAASGEHALGAIVAAYGFDSRAFSQTSKRCCEQALLPGKPFAL